MEKLKSILSKILSIDESKVNDRTSPENVESWDSFSGLVLVSELERSFGVKFTMAEVATIKSVKDIKELLKKQGIILQETK